MKVIEGRFGSKEEPPEIPKKTIPEFLEAVGFDKVVPDTVIIIAEHGGNIHTMSQPDMSVVELIGALEMHKFITNMMMVMGELEG